MRTLLCLLLLASIPAAHAADTATAPKAKPAAKSTKSEGSKASLLARFKKTCLQNSTAEGHSQKELCGCLETNLGAKLNPAQLSLLVKFYEGDVEAKTQVQKAENSALLDFDMEAADHCMEDPQWKAPAGPLKEEDPEDAALEKPEGSQGEAPSHAPAKTKAAETKVEKAKAQ